MLMDQLVRCLGCSLNYLNPRVKHEIILQSYSDAVDPMFIEQNEQRVKTFTRTLKSLMARHHIKVDETKTVLDIGCAGGAFPKAASDLGFSAVGVEPSRWLSNEARKRYALDIRTGVLEDQDFTAQSFDMVTMWDVIEHLIDPGGIVDKIHHLLHADGTLVINYPDQASLAQKLMGKKWPFYLSVHLTYFTPTTITKFLNQHGFAVVEIRPFWQTLQLGYVLQRASAYFKIFGAAKKAIESIGLGSQPFHYQLGQTLVVARKSP
jgi:predicted TPR repeat methyltransferase